jgi:hypothetical protein
VQTPLLPQQPAPVTPAQAALTARLLTPRLADLEALLLSLRAETDAALAPNVGPTLGPVAGKAYPYGRCREITNAFLEPLRARLQDAEAPAERALRDFLRQGGLVRPIWGALRGQYFQNALQVGSLYVDVANDTVTVTKPKVEILPLAESGFAAVRDAAHFAEVAERYWGARLFANHALPELAPHFPLVSLAPGGTPRLQSGTDYMIDLFRRDGFTASEAWLAEAPPPPDEATDRLRARGRERLGHEGAAPGRLAALAACRAAREDGAQRDEARREAAIRAYLRLHGEASAELALAESLR